MSAWINTGNGLKRKREGLLAQAFWLMDLGCWYYALERVLERKLSRTVAIVCASDLTEI